MVAMIVYAVLIFCLLIFVHELGHFATAKAVGIKVNEFALGMGPVLLHFKKGDTEYSLRAFPIGGFCKMEGEDEDSDDAFCIQQQATAGKGSGYSCRICHESVSCDPINFHRHFIRRDSEHDN